MKISTLLLILLGAVCLVYANHFTNSFHFDDSHAVVDNPYIRDLANIPKFFTDATTFSVLPANQTYRPTVTTSLALDYAAGHGYKPFWFHLSTFVWFLAQLSVMYLLFANILGVVRPLASSAYVALLATAWYGVHPAIAETVNYIIQRGDLYSTFGVMAGLVLYARFPQWRRTGLYLVPVAFGALSKPPALVFPFLLFFLAFYFEEGVTRRGLISALRKALPSLLLCALLAWLQATMTPKSYLPAILSAYSYRITQPFVWLRYFETFFVPVHLSADSDLGAFSAVDGRVLLGFAFAAAVLVAIWLTARKPVLRPISFGLLWFVITLLPTSVYALSEIENDHRMFFPFVGLTLAVTWTLALCFERYRDKFSAPVVRGAVAAFCLCLLAPYAYGTWRRNEVWRSEESLWLDVTKKSPHNGRGLMNYGLTQMSAGKCRVALDYFERALSYTPNYPTLEINLGIANGCLGNVLQARWHFERAVALAPLDYSTHFYYGRWLLGQGRYSDAAAQLKETADLNPAWLEGRGLLMEAYADAGDINSARQVAESTLRTFPADVAARQFRSHPPPENAEYWIKVSLRQYQAQQYAASITAAQQALKQKPNSFEAYTNIGAAYGAMGLWDLAIANEQQALRLNPSFALAQRNLLWYEQQKRNSAVHAATAEQLLDTSLHYHQAGQYRQSIEAARAALRLRPNYPEAYNNIAAAYEALGEWNQAIAACQEALRLKPDFQLAKNNLAWSLEQKKKATP